MTRCNERCALKQPKMGTSNEDYKRANKLQQKKAAKK